MTRHSKSNNARPHFSNAELEMVKDRWGSKKSRVGSESMRLFDSCSICLAVARDPVVCNQGHLFCKECIITDLLSQKQEIQRQSFEIEKMQRQEEIEREQSRLKARERVLRDFERSSDSLLSSAAKSGAPDGSDGSGSGSGEKGKRKRTQDAREDGSGHENENENEIVSTETNNQDSTTASSSSLSSLPSRIQQLSSQAEEAALKALEAEQEASRKAKLPSFWLPSLTPSQKEGKISLSQLKKSLNTRCKVSEFGHDLNLKGLKDVKFTKITIRSSSNNRNQTGNATESETETSDQAQAQAQVGGQNGCAKNPARNQQETQTICPSCKKGLTNSSTLIVISKCGHVICSACVSRLVRPCQACSECDVPIKKLDKELITLQREGTGYSAAGNAQTKTRGTAFQG